MITLENLRDINLLSIIARMLCALICGGAIGYEREIKGKYAGFRTHILICLGSAITTCTSQYMFLVLNQYTDMARLGAQVVAGLGFIGAGTIVVTQNRRIKGLTTAAGLWTVGIIGLCAGAGFYEGAIVATLLMLFAGTIVAKIEDHKFGQFDNIDLVIEFKKQKDLKALLTYFRDVDVEVDSLSVNTDDELPSGVFSIRLHRKITIDDILADIKNFPYVEKVYKL